LFANTVSKILVVLSKLSLSTESFMLKASSKYKQGIKKPSAVSLILLQDLQKSSPYGSIIPN